MKATKFPVATHNLEAEIRKREVVREVSPKQGRQSDDEERTFRGLFSESVSLQAWLSAGTKTASDTM